MRMPVLIRSAAHRVSSTISPAKGARVPIQKANIHLINLAEPPFPHEVRSAGQVSKSYVRSDFFIRVRAPAGRISIVEEVFDGGYHAYDLE